MSSLAMTICKEYGITERGSAECTERLNKLLRPWLGNMTHLAGGRTQTSVVYQLRKHGVPGRRPNKNTAL